MKDVLWNSMQCHNAQCLSIEQLQILNISRTLNSPFILVDAIQVSIDKVGMRKVPFVLQVAALRSPSSPLSAGFRLYTGALDDSDGAGRLGGLTVGLFASTAG
jgi:hypothetical protein